MVLFHAGKRRGVLAWRLVMATRLRELERRSHFGLMVMLRSAFVLHHR